MGNTRIPQYDKSVGFEVTAQPDVAGTAMSMINSFRQFSGEVASISQTVSKEAALDQREILKNNIQTAYRGFALDALKNPDQNAGLAGYGESSKQYSQQLLAQTDHFNKPYVNNLLQYYHSEHQAPIEKNAILQNKRVEQVGAYDRINNASVAVTDAINNSHPMVDEDGRDAQFSAAQALYAEKIKGIERDAAQGLIPAERLGDMRLQADKDFKEQVFLKRYQDYADEGKGNQFIQELRDANLEIPGFSIADKTKLISKMIYIRDQGKSAAGITVAQANSKISDESKRVANGGTPNLQLQHEIEAISPEYGARLKEEVGMAQFAYAAKQGAMYKSPSELAQYKRDITPKDVNDPDYSHLKRISETAIKAIDTQDKEFRANPMQQVMQNPAIKEAVNTYEQAFNSNSVGQDHLYTPFNSQVQKPWPSIIKAQLDRGLTLHGEGSRQGSAGSRVRLLDNSQVPEMVNSVMTGDAKSSLELMNRWKEEYGTESGAFNLVLKQLVDGGMPADYAIMANIDPNSKDAKDAATAIKTPASLVDSELKKAPGNVSTLIEKSAYGQTFGTAPVLSDSFKGFMSTLSRYNGQVDAEYLNDMSASIHKIANWYALTHGLQPAQAVKKAEDIIASRYNYTSLNNTPIRLPHDLPPIAVRDFAAKMEAKLPTFGFNVGTIDAKNNRERIQQGHWKNDNVDNGLVWVDVNGRMPVDHNGHPFSFSFDEARTGVENKKTPPAKPLTAPLENAEDESDINPDIREIDARGVEALKKANLYKGAQ